jgi:hypothetical protein
MTKSSEVYCPGAAVAAMDQAVGVGGAPEGHRQRVDDEQRVLVFVHRPSDDAAMAQVADGGEVELAFAGGELGDVGDPPQVRSLGAETRCSRSSAGATSGRPRRHFLRVWAPTNPCSRMIRATRRRDAVIWRRRVS